MQLMKMSASSTISLKGPPVDVSTRKALEREREIPFLVSSRSHLIISSSGIPTSLANWTAPLPHRPSYIKSVLVIDLCR